MHAFARISLSDPLAPTCGTKRLVPGPNKKRTSCHIQVRARTRPSTYVRKPVSVRTRVRSIMRHSTNSPNRLRQPVSGPVPHPLPPGYLEPQTREHRWGKRVGTPPVPEPNVNRGAPFGTFVEWNGELKKRPVIRPSVRIFFHKSALYFDTNQSLQGG